MAQSEDLKKFEKEFMTTHLDLDQFKNILQLCRDYIAIFVQERSIDESCLQDVVLVLQCLFNQSRLRSVYFQNHTLSKLYKHKLYDHAAQFEIPSDNVPPGQVHSDQFNLLNYPWLLNSHIKQDLVEDCRNLT